MSTLSRLTFYFALAVGAGTLAYTAASPLFHVATAITAAGRIR